MRYPRKLLEGLKRTVAVCAVAALTFGVSVITPPQATAEDISGATDQPAALTQNVKTATTLDENLETKVTLSFPGQREAEPADVVFVLDKSGASAQTDIFKQAKAFLEEINQKAKADGLNIKVGVVLFNKMGNVQLPLTDVVAGYDDILNAMNSSVRSGTNMHAGLLAAKSILDADTAVKAENKHVILISDGATYLYCKDGDFTKPYTRSFGSVEGGRNMMGGIWEWQSREYHTDNAWKKFSDGSNFIFSQAMKSPEKLGEYLAYYRDQYENSDNNWAQYDYEYTAIAANTGTTNPIPVDVTAPCNIDVAFWSTDDTFQSMVNAGYDMNVYYKNAADFDGQVFLKYLVRNSNNGELNTDFDKLKAKLVDKIAAGSTVEDTIGANFDFVNDPAKISLTANDEKLSPEKIDATTYGFGKKSDGTYRFTLKYQAGENEKLTLTLNEAATPSRPVVLEYSELLVNKPTEPGTHTLKVNESAVLHPIDGNGVAGEAYEFPVPTVDYTVAKPDPTPQPGATDKPSDNGAATDKPGAKTALAKTGDEAFAIGMGCLLVAGASACAIATALKRRRN
ncbi:vWA domain-containing protein [Ellagibacter isourolithinifaciens]|uniref:vWA domain-containing protein n=1 Tax=Ellagibacter isourolithinifaciens TaxID=2137581 RepID=UPI003A8E227C